MSLTICRCEQVSDEDVRAAIDVHGARTHNEVRLITRAGKGTCQGRCCESLVRQLVAHHLHQDPGEVQRPRSRVPVRPVPVVAVGSPEDAPPAAGNVLSMMTLRGH